MVFKSRNAKFYHDLLKIAEYKLKQIKWVLISLAVPVLKTKKVIIDISWYNYCKFCKGEQLIFSNFEIELFPFTTWYWINHWDNFSPDAVVRA